MVLEEYVTKYGDYHESITKAVNQLKQLDYLINAVNNEYAKRDLPVPSESSHNASQDDTDGCWQPAKMHWDLRALNTTVAPSPLTATYCSIS
ncbi:unnamed protein product [Heligmosomoides polygyrus]|uniref:ING domain-containing protein n=1 Tax=Heligmosomoides polygyrus TaxID=6339 RepID=A0A183GN93_HELPZ|nr:unnamed protein product [Heligmosomoides polygyrus]